MIHLDTNYLIRLLVAGSPEAARVDQWLGSGESLAVSAPAWTECLNGPVRPQEVSLVGSIIGARVIPFDQETAVAAATLFNQTGRRRGSRFDCLIAATAMVHGADFATENRGDFSPSVHYGLKLLA